MKLTPEIVVERVLAYDISPPSQDYSHIEYGSEVARALSPSECRSLVRRAFSTLPPNIVEDLAEGIFETCTPFTSLNDFLRLLDDCSHIGSGGSLVQLAIRFSLGSEEEIVTDLLIRIKISAPGKSQDRLSYALWALLGSETLDLRSSTGSRPLVKQYIKKINEAIEASTLSDYSSKLLASILATAVDQGNAPEQSDEQE